MGLLIRDGRGGKGKGRKGEGGEGMWYWHTICTASRIYSPAAEMAGSIYLKLCTFSTKFTLHVNINVKKNCCIITMCKAHSKVTYKTAKIFSIIT